MKPAPVLFYCQHQLGLGHWRRGALLAQALADSGQSVLFVTGGLPAPEIEWAGVEQVGLPPLTASDEAATGLALPDGRPPDAAYLADRRARLLELVSREDPAIVLLELFPFGRHAFAFELAPLLLALAQDRAHRGPAAPRVVVSLRDILVSKKNQPWSELSVLAVVRQWVDRVLVHGSPDLVPLSRTFGLAEELGSKLVYTGYLAAPQSPAAGSLPEGEVVVSGGGGRVAGHLLQTALAARALCPAAAALPWRLLTGPYMPAAARAELETLAARGLAEGRPPVVVETFRPDFSALLRGAALSISQAGYNTVVDVLTSRVPAILVPYEGTGDEQPLRADLLAARGLAGVVRESALSPESLAAAMQDALTAPRAPSPPSVDLDGAKTSVGILTELARDVMAARQTAAGLEKR